MPPRCRQQSALCSQRRRHKLIHVHTVLDGAGPFSCNRITRQSSLWKHHQSCCMNLLPSRMGQRRHSWWSAQHIVRRRSLLRGLLTTCPCPSKAPRKVIRISSGWFKGLSIKCSLKGTRQHYLTTSKTATSNSLTGENRFLWEYLKRKCTQGINLILCLLFQNL